MFERLISFILQIYILALGTIDGNLIFVFTLVYFQCFFLFISHSLLKGDL